MKKQQKNFQLAVIAVLAVAVCTFAIGFAAYSQDLIIGGTTTVKANKWDIHFGTIGSTDKSQGVEADVNIDTSNTKIDFTATLSKPGDFYSFTVPVVNAGTFDAALTSIETTLTAGNYSNEDLAKFLEFEVKVADKASTVTTTSLADGLSKTGLNVALAKDITADNTVTVTVKYKEEADGTNNGVAAKDLPTEDIVVKSTTKLHYDQQK